MYALSVSQCELPDILANPITLEIFKASAALLPSVHFQCCALLLWMCAFVCFSVAEIA
jgi:hypothetical protein